MNKNSNAKKQKGINQHEKIFSKFYIVLIALFCVLLTACHISSEEPQEYPKIELQEPLLGQPSKDLQVPEEKTELTYISVEKEKLEETIEKDTSSAFKLPDNVFITQVYRNYDGDQEVLTFKKDGLLQFWVNENMICQKQIPVPAEVSIGNNFYEVIGNPYISTDGELVLIQSYTTPEGKQKLDYTILAKNCSKIIWSLNYDGYVFQNYDGKYGLVFYRYTPPFPWYPYEGFGFNTVDDDFTLPTPTTIWLDKSTVKSVNFGDWGSSSYGYRDISAISVRLEVDSYGELDIAQVGDSFEPVEVDIYFIDFLHEKFAPEEYNKRYSKVLQMINEYAQER